MKLLYLGFLVIIVSVPVHGNSYKFLKVENFKSSDENIFKINSFEVSSSRLNFTFDILQPLTKIYVSFSSNLTYPI